MREFNVIIERGEEGWFVATVPGLRGCHTQAKSLDQLIERVKGATVLCLETGRAAWSSESAAFLKGTLEISFRRCCYVLSSSM